MSGSDFIKWPAVTIHPSQHPDVLEGQLKAALEARRIPSKFHYLTPQQARRWLGVHLAYSPSSGEDETTAAAYRDGFAAVAAEFSGRPVQLISLGCGGGQKDAMLAAALRAAGVPMRYIAMDASPSLTIAAADAFAAAAPGAPIRRLVADLDAVEDWRPYVLHGAPDGEAQIVLAFGIIPNAEPETLLARVKEWMAPGDKLLLTSNLYNPASEAADLAAILPQYDNPETQHWLGTFFTDLDWPLPAEGLAFRLEANGSPAQIRARFVLPEAATVYVGGQKMEFEKGGTFEAFFSNRFRPADLTALLERQGFGDVSHTETLPDQEGIWGGTLT